VSDDDQKKRGVGGLAEGGKRVFSEAGKNVESPLIVYILSGAINPLSVLHFKSQCKILLNNRILL
jgi:hypothetical protein